MLKEFKEFAVKGNAFELAVGVIIAGAFGLIVASLVNDIIMPIIGAIFGGFDFTNLYVPLAEGVSQGLSLEEARESGAVLAYGNFIQVTVNFLIVAFVLFLVIRAMNNMKKKEEEAPEEEPAPSAEEVLLAQIRDELRARKV
ncbi:MAG: large conductance mechanosensitive channel protein MscL [Pseudomonadota bacterium]